MGMKTIREKHKIYDDNGLRITVEIEQDIETPILDELHRRIGHKLWLDRLQEEVEWVLNG